MPIAPGGMPPVLELELASSFAHLPSWKMGMPIAPGGNAWPVDVLDGTGIPIAPGGMPPVLELEPLPSSNEQVRPSLHSSAERQRLPSSPGAGV
jgi:hypothetical protein